MKITIFNGKIHYNWLFSIAMLNYQRVSWKEVTTNIIFTHSLLSSLIQASNMVDIFIWPVDRNFPTAPPKQTIQNRVELGLNVI